jgi:hypothetical protein
MDWSHLIQDKVSWRALVNKGINRQVPYTMGNSLGSKAIIIFSMTAN